MFTVCFFSGSKLRISAVPCSDCRFPVQKTFLCKFYRFEWKIKNIIILNCHKSNLKTRRKKKGIRYRNTVKRYRKKVKRYKKGMCRKKIRKKELDDMDEWAASSSSKLLGGLSLWDKLHAETGWQVPQGFLLTATCRRNSLCISVHKKKTWGN